MLASSRRLRTAEVAEVVRTGKPLRAKFLSAKLLTSASGGLRSAAVIGKAVAKKAVVRNRARRALYRALAELPRSEKHLHAVFFIRTIPDMPLTPAFRADLEQLLH